MFRVITKEEKARVLITIDGELSREYVEIVERCCEQARRSGKVVHLLLRDLCLIDQSGRQLLQRLAANGTCLQAKGLYDRQVIQECQAKFRRLSVVSSR